MFTVIIPVHNKLPHIDRAIHSVLNQTFKKFELLLIDDASTDGSSEKLREYKDSRIRHFRRKTPGPGGYAARNLGIKEAKYEWIAFLDADDEWQLDFLKKRVEIINKFPDLQIISSRYIRKKNNIILNKNHKNWGGKENESFTLLEYLDDNGYKYMWTGAVSIKKELLTKVGMFPERKCKRGGDLDTWIRCLSESSNNIFINQILSVYYRDTVNQVTDTEKNPITKLCSFETLENIRKNTDNKYLLKSIDRFYSKYVWSRLVSNLKQNKKIDKSHLSIIRSSGLRIKLRVKAAIYYVMIILNLK